MLGTEEDGSSRDGHDLFVAFQGHFLDRMGRAANAGISNQARQLAIRLNCELNGFDPVLFLRNIEVEVRGFSAGRLDFLNDLLPAFVIDVRYDDGMVGLFGES
jgi:hypothetical protein